MAQDTTNQMQPVCHALSQPERVYLTKKPREQKEASTVELNKRIMFFQRVHENVVSGYIMVAGNLLDEYRSSHKLSLEETYQTYEDMNGLTAGSYTDFMHSLNANHISGFYKKMSFANASIDEYLQTRSDREIAFILDANRDMKINMLDYEIIERNLIASGQQSTIMRAIIMDRLKAYEQKFNDQIQELLCPQSVVNQPADIEPSEVEQ